MAKLTAPVEALKVNKYPRSAGPEYFPIKVGATVIVLPRLTQHEQLIAPVISNVLVSKMLND
jgi:hypothetical protein